MAKSRYLVGFPAQKKEPKWFQNLGRFKKNSSTQWPKKSPKNWTGPCLTLNMVRRNRFSKWQTPARNAKSSFEAANPMPLPNSAAATGCQNDDGIETYCGGPWIWRWQNCTFRAPKLEPHLLVKVHDASAPWLKHCGPQCDIIRMAAEIDIAIF